MEPTDIELMLRVRSGEVAAFELLARRYREPLRRFFRSLLTDPAQAEDLVQETVLRLWLLRARYEPSGRFSSYLFTIARHHWLNQRKRFRPELGLEIEDAEGAEAAPEPEALALARLRDGRIRRAVADLPVHYRLVFRMSHLEGLRYAEIARRLGIAEGTVKSRMAEAVRRLRAALSEEREG